MIYLTFIPIYSYNLILLAMKTQEKSTFLATFKHTKQYSYKKISSEYSLEGTMLKLKLQ